MSEPTIRFYGTVVNGKRTYFRPQLHQKALEKLEGKQFEEVIKQRFEDESPNQHAYYRGGIIKATCMETELFGGWSEVDIHDYFAKKFLTNIRPKVLKFPDGTETTIEVAHTESTGDLGKKRMSEFIDRVLIDLAENNIFPLTPEDYYYGKYSEQVKQQKS